jgi:Domain of unknown function (DUF4166)
VRIGTQSAQTRAPRRGSVKRRVAGGPIPTQGGVVRARAGGADPPVTDANLPFGPALGAVEDELPRIFRRQFLRPGDGVVLDGAMHRVWRRGRALRPVFSLLSRFDLLFAETGVDVPARLVIRPTDAGRHRWSRTFAFPHPRRFDATVAYSPEVGRPVELVGPRDCVELAWDVRFDPPGRLVISTESARLIIGRRAFRLPQRLTPCVVAVQEAISDEELSIALVLSAPGIGPIFGYDGRFRLRRG